MPGENLAERRHLRAAEEASDDPVDAWIMAALLRLPARQRQVVALRLVLDLDTGRAGEILSLDR